MAPVTLADIVSALGGELHGPAELRIGRLASLASAGADALAFAAGERSRKDVLATQAGALVVPPSLLDAAAARGAVIVAADAHLYFARLTQWWVARRRPPETKTPARGRRLRLKRSVSGQGERTASPTWTSRSDCHMSP